MKAAEKERKSERKKLEKISKSEKFQDRFLVETGRQLSGRPGPGSGESPATLSEMSFFVQLLPGTSTTFLYREEVVENENWKNFLSPKNWKIFLSPDDG